ncbi:cell division protein FtsA [Thermotoga profunda]|uniref:cell division protein FtsA n=1 Tax=Thermotoga profunda TaxID=1508420 RepID=UPI000597D846|nr:cell division protein FtsA [Thermotoga profunda]
MIFALDVGTRKVAGLIGYIENDVLNVVDFETIEHPTRNMLDGQIHDIKGTAMVIEAVKKRLEERNEVKLEEVAVAVAGRFLKTVVLEAEQDFSGDLIDENTVKQLEMKAISQIPQNDDSGSELYCVGYSVIEYRLDGFWIKNLIGHRGKKLYVRVVAALLPVQVVDAMIIALRRAGLRPCFLTLEPMAALEIAVPEDLRILNIALIDIGAGTSDIAIAKGGTIVGYDMVPMAGDEVTEVIAQSFLLDFLSAEKLKRTINDNTSFEAIDVTGNKIVINGSSVVKAISPTVEMIAKSIAEKIKQLNLARPSALFLIGGGAKLRYLQNGLAHALDLPIERVALRTVEELQKVKSLRQDFKGSEYVTLAGIAYVSAYNSGSIYDTVSLNGEKIRLIKIGQNQSILQLLVQKGFKFTEIFGTPQPTITFELNSEIRTIPGKISGGMKVLLNGTEVPLHTTIRSGDEIVVEYNKIEKSTEPKIEGFVKQIIVEVDQQEFTRFWPKIFINNELVEDLDHPIKDGDKVLIQYPNAEEIKKAINEKFGIVNYSINGESRTAQKVFCELVEIQDKDEKEERYIFKTRKTKIKDVLPKSEPIKVFFNDEEVIISQMNNVVMVNGEYLSTESELLEGMSIEYSTWQPIIADVLAKVNLKTDGIIDYKIFLNERPVNFAAKINQNDKIRFEVFRKAQPTQS